MDGASHREHRVVAIPRPERPVDGIVDLIVIPRCLSSERECVALRDVAGVGAEGSLAPVEYRADSRVKSQTHGPGLLGRVEGSGSQVDLLEPVAELSRLIEDRFDRRAIAVSFVTFLKSYLSGLRGDGDKDFVSGGDRSGFGEEAFIGRERVGYGLVGPVRFEPVTLLLDTGRCGPLAPSNGSDLGSFRHEALEHIGPFGELVVLLVGFEKSELPSGHSGGRRVQAGLTVDDDCDRAGHIDAELCGVD